MPFLKRFSSQDLLEEGHTRTFEIQEPPPEMEQAQKEDEPPGPRDGQHRVNLHSSSPQPQPQQLTIKPSGGGLRRVFSNLSIRTAGAAFNSQIIQTAIRKLVHSASSVPQYAAGDAKRLQTAIEYAGSHAYGVIGVEVWEYESKTTNLKMPEGGLWISSLLETSTNDAMQTLTKDPKFCPPQSQSVGVSLEGELWARARGTKNVDSADVSSIGFGLDELTSSRHSLTTSRHSLSASMGKAARLMQNMDNRRKGEHCHLRSDVIAAALAAELQPHYHHHGKTVVWRDVEQLYIDPDTPKCPRLKVQLDAGFGQAAAISFQAHGHEGIVIFFCRACAHRTKQGQALINSMENQEFLFRQTKLIGSILSNAYAGRALQAAKQRLLRAAWAKFCRNLLEHHRKLQGRRPQIDGDRIVVSRLYSQGSYISLMAQRSWSQAKHTPPQILQWTRRYVCKWKSEGGGSNLIPPPMNAAQSGWTWLGAFCGLLVLSAYNEWIKRASDGKYELLIGPMGALMTLLYGLHSAPASQPRNVVLGQVISGAVSLSFTYIPESILPVWIRRAVGPAFAIAAMVKCGVPHPPAGAHAVIYAGGKNGWVEYCFVVLGAAISVAPAVIINNLSIRRQYPVYWGYFLERWRNRGTQSNTKRDGKDADLS